jgi:hypothetical protein
MRLKTIVIALGVVAVAFVAALKAMDWFAPSGNTPAPALVELPPLPPAQASSTIVAPVAIAIAAIRDVAERNAPKTFNGRADNPLPQLLKDADIKWTVARGPIATIGAPEGLSLTTPLNGTLNVTGALSGSAQAAIGDALGSLLGGNVAKQFGSINIKAFNANADIRGQVGMMSKPTLLPNWRIEPGLTAQVNLSDTNLSVSGIRVNVPNEVKPVIDRNVNEQLAQVQQRIRNDPALEQAARREWTKLCRSLPLQGTAPGLPALWLEMKPNRVIAAQPKIDAANVTLTLGIEAETRITPAATTPECKFPAEIAIEPARPSVVDINVPVDMPFTELTKVVQAQIVGKTFPEDGSGAVAVTVKTASIAASGDRLLISMRVNAIEKKSFFGLGGEATIHIWGRPSLDRAQQTLRLTDMTLAVESEAAFGLLGSAARAAIPYLQSAIAERATVDLKPFAASAQQQIGTLIAELQKNENGVRIAAQVTSLQLAGITFDSKTLRVLANAKGGVSVAVSALP